jgi:hypothetical protein
MERAAARTDALVARAHQAGVLRATAMDLTCSSGSSSATVLGPPYRRACSTATLREVTSSVSANGGEALCGVSFSQVAGDRKWRSYAFS